jgi:hypothetical protein
MDKLVMRGRLIILSRFRVKVTIELLRHPQVRRVSISESHRYAPGWIGWKAGGMGARLGMTGWGWG